MDGFEWNFIEKWGLVDRDLIFWEQFEVILSLKGIIEVRIGARVSLPSFETLNEKRRNELPRA